MGQGQKGLSRTSLTSATVCSISASLQVMVCTLGSSSCSHGEVSLRVLTAVLTELSGSLRVSDFVTSWGTGGSVGVLGVYQCVKTWGRVMVWQCLGFGESRGWSRGKGGAP